MNRLYNDKNSCRLIPKLINNHFLKIQNVFVHAPLLLTQFTHLLVLPVSFFFKSKTHTRVNGRFLIGRNRTKRSRFSRFVLFRPIKKRSFNFFVFWIFFQNADRCGFFYAWFLFSKLCLICWLRVSPTRNLRWTGCSVLTNSPPPPPWKFIYELYSANFTMRVANFGTRTFCLFVCYLLVK